MFIIGLAVAAYSSADAVLCERLLPFRSEFYAGTKASGRVNLSSGLRIEVIIVNERFQSTWRMSLVLRTKATRGEGYYKIYHGLGLVVRL